MDLLNNGIKKRVDVQNNINDMILIALGKLVKNNSQKLVRVHNQVCENWRAKHGSKFSSAHYQLIHIIRKQNIVYIVGVKLQGRFLVKKVITVVNLGITLYLKLN